MDKKAPLADPSTGVIGMKCLLIVTLLASVSVIQGAETLLSQTARPGPPLKSQPIAEGLHLITGEGGNVLLYVTDEGAILVDAMFDRNHEDLMAQVKAITNKPLRYVFNTHQHDDHAGGDAKILKVAEVVAHKNLRANLLDIKQPYYEDTPGTPIGIPRLTYSDELSIGLGGREVRALHFGPAHTRGDSIIHFPGERVIHMGDLFLNTRATPRPGAPARPLAMPIYVDSAQGGSLINWSRVYERTLALDFVTIIPGHGPPATRADLEKFAADLAAMRTRLMGLVKGGSSKAQIVKILEDDYGWRSTGCPPSPPTAGCLQYQQVDSLIAELRNAPVP